LASLRSPVAVIDPSGNAIFAAVANRRGTDPSARAGLFVSSGKMEARVVVGIT